MAIFLTKSTWPIIGWIAEVLGWLMNGIYYVISAAGLPNVGVAIILFTIVMYAAMTPLQIQQQRFSKLNAIMSPELQKIQARYKGKTDEVSRQKQMDETNAVYSKYGASPTGSCVQLLIQMPVMFALYQVIYKIPGYITIIGDRLKVLATDTAFTSFFTTFVGNQKDNALTQALSTGSTENIIDAIYKLNTKQWAAILSEGAGNSFSDALTNLHSYIQRATSFLGLNISDSPMNIFTTAWSSKAWLLIIASIIIPVLAWITQWLNYKLMPQPAQNPDKEPGTMESTMKSMNNFMPIMSAVFCFTLPVGVGIYWIAGAVVRSVQQVVINRKLDKESIDEIIKASQEKANKKRAKQGLPPQKITSSAHVSTRSFEAEEKLKSQGIAEKAEKTKAQIKDSTAYYNNDAKPGSIASKANMVKHFDEKSAKKK